MKNKTEKIRKKHEKAKEENKLSSKELLSSLISETKEIPALERRLHEIRSRIGKAAVFHIGLREDGVCDILGVESAIPRDSSEVINEIMENIPQTKKKSVSYIG